MYKVMYKVNSEKCEILLENGDKILFFLMAFTPRNRQKRRLVIGLIAWLLTFSFSVGMTRFELATPRPPAEKFWLQSPG